jgi:hypothetical protein
MPNGPQCEPTCYLVAACPSPAWVR